ncbi:MAG TPA: SURF1 family protein [Ornithinimicrobium sp.]|uniref:SURF1 family protein n=1 Tax=Ornithinimicrobium sp. TaxID=1977084 RepID=UPI002B483C7A|nr:SURF1 family protein [Ornithinimicrobium sp.]HKJ12844.1 SURF1 family protein [Ornithinimicrobium sp.]
MLRTALQPRWLALLALLVVIVIAFAQLGRWQMGRASDASATERLEQQASAPAMPVDQVTRPYAPYDDAVSGRTVFAQGRYLADLQFLVPDRVLDSRRGWWVVVPLRTDEGALLPVLRGWVSDPDLAVAPDARERTVTGTLAPSESATGGSQEGLAEGERASVDLAALANEWPGELYNAFVFATEESPPVSGGDVRPVPPPALVPEAVDWRNVGYGLQWWVFAGFAVYMYLRFLHQASRPRPERSAPRPTVAS